MKASIAVIISGIVILQSCIFCRSSSEETLSSTEQPNGPNSSLKKDHTSLPESELVHPERAECTLALQRIELTIEDDPSKVYLPPFLMINRCSGCCSSSQLTSCQPIARVIRNYEVMVNYMEGENMTSKINLFAMEEHTGPCKCLKMPERELSFGEKILKITGRMVNTAEDFLQPFHYTSDTVQLPDTLASVTRCRPELQTIDFRDHIEYGRSQWFHLHPPCTKIRRCGGFCPDLSQTCQPATTITRNYKVEVLEQNGVHVVNRTIAIIPLEEHTSCACSCNGNQTECNKKQRFNSAMCSCECLNIDDAKTCTQNNKRKFWDSESCSCRCQNEKSCDDNGIYFDEYTCSCQLKPLWLFPSQSLIGN